MSEAAKRTADAIARQLGGAHGNAWESVNRWKLDHVPLGQRLEADIVHVQRAELYALTGWQPWFSAIVVGPKDIENRPWRPPDWILGQYIAIHAGKTWDEDAVAWLRARGWDLPDEVHKHMPRGAIIGIARVDNVVSESASPFFIGPYGWVLSDRQALAAPVRCPGHQKLWRVPEDIRAYLVRQFPMLAGEGRAVAP